MRNVALLINAAGEPALIQATLRESESAPGRIKVGFVAPAVEGLGVRVLQNGHDNSQAFHPEGSEGAAPVAAEFRLEMS